MGRTRRVRCPFCGKLFWPDLRVQDRQWACNKPECQAQRRRETQRRYRASRPAERLARRLCEAIVEAKSEGPRAAPDQGIMQRFPWDEVRDEISPQLHVILGFLGNYVFCAGRDETSTQLAVLQTEMGRLVRLPREDVFDGG
jgi:hypothetical protein